MSIRVGTHIYPNTEEGKAAAAARAKLYGDPNEPTEPSDPKPKAKAKAKKKAS